MNRRIFLKKAGNALLTSTGVICTTKLLSDDVITKTSQSMPVIEDFNLFGVSLVENDDFPFEPKRSLIERYGR